MALKKQASQTASRITRTKAVTGTTLAASANATSDNAPPERSKPRRAARPVKQSTQTEAQRQAILDLKKRMDAQTHASRPEPSTHIPRKPRRSSARKSVKSADDIVAEELQRAADQEASPTAGSPHQTLPRPSAHGSVPPALANFQRRIRQPSLLAMVRHTSVAAAQDDTVESSLDDFAPHDESTPLNTAKSLAVPGGDDDDLYGYSPQPRVSKKRRSDEMEADDSIVQVPQSPIIDSASPSRALDHVTIPSTEPHEEDNPSLCDDDSDTPQPQQLPESDTYADPMSSSPPPPPPQRPTQATARTTTRQKPTEALTTATLRALLPRPRHRNDDNAQPSDSPEPQNRPRAKSAYKSIRSKPTAAARTRQRRASGASNKENHYPTEAPRSKQHKRTKAVSVLSSSSLSPPPSPPTKGQRELQAARDKFLLVDQYEMEFESAPSLAGGGGLSRRTKAGDESGRYSSGSEWR